MSNLNLFGEDEEEGIVDGFVEGDKELDYFPIKRVIQVKLYHYQDKIYVKTREVASLLDIKQPFEFVAGIKRFSNNKGIIKEEQSRPFRDRGDNNKTTFVELKTLYAYLTKVSDSPGYQTHIFKDVMKTLETMIKSY